MISAHIRTQIAKYQFWNSQIGPAHNPPLIPHPHPLPPPKQPKYSFIHFSLLRNDPYCPSVGGILSTDGQIWQLKLHFCQCVLKRCRAGRAETFDAYPGEKETKGKDSAHDSPVHLDQWETPCQSAGQHHRDTSWAWSMDILIQVHASFS